MGVPFLDIGLNVDHRASVYGIRARYQKIKGLGDVGIQHGIDHKAGRVIAHRRAFLDGRAEIEEVVDSVRGGMLPKDPDRSQAGFFLPAFSSAMDRMDSALFRSSR